MKRDATIRLTAPAKINLGLEILGKRDDGYHEIRTVMAMIELADRLEITRREGHRAVRIAGVPGLAAEDNLIAKAVNTFRSETGHYSGYEVTVEKIIPSPGGLGGASSDAAATLLALNTLHEHRLSDAVLLELAGSLGSDVPFFLGSPVALATGTGTTLTPLPPLDGWLVLVVPELAIQEKTPTLYRSLLPDDFSDGTHASAVADAIAHGSLPSAELLGNAFSRALAGLAPHLESIPQAMTRAGASHVALSGAGPTHYSLAGSESEANDLAQRMRRLLPPGTLVIPTRFLRRRPAAERIG